MKFHVLKNDKGYYWHLKATNGEKIAWSGETYVRKVDCLAGIALVKQSSNAPVATALHVAYFNFCWRTRDSREGGYRPTPCQMAGVTKEQWTVEDLYRAVS